jgi:transposase
MRRAPTVSLSEADRMWLEKQVKSGLTAKRLVDRSRIVLMAAEGVNNEQIAKEMGMTSKAVGVWRGRFVKEGRQGIERDKPGRGRKPSYPPELQQLVVGKTTRGKPADGTHWSRASMAAALDISPSTVGRIWKANGLKPHLARTFKVSNDPNFVEKLEDIVGLYLAAPEHAIVLCCDEKSQIQALDRTQPGLPLKKGRAETMTHDYVRHGTTTLFAALNVADGKVISQCQPRHRHLEWLNFLKQIDRQTPADRDLHLILDNYATHKHPKVKAWLSRHPRFHLHFTPTSASWLNMVERFFRDVTSRRLRRGVFHSVPDLVKALEEYVAHHNLNPSPFVWTAKAADILTKVKLARKKLKPRLKGA